MKKVLLINPPIDETLMKAKYKAVSPPLGLLWIGAVLLQSGFVVDFIEGDKEKGVEDIIKSVEAFSPDYVGISSTSMSFINAVKLAEGIKSFNSNIHIVVGGQLASYNADRILKKYSSIDSVSVGEGEYTILELVKGNSLDTIKGLVFRKGKEIIFNEPREMIEDLDSIPLPARQLAGKYHYGTKFKFYHIFRHTLSKMFNYIPIMTSRGCPGGCYFCSGTQFNDKRIRFRSIESVINEFNSFIEAGYDSFFITDAHFTAYPPRVIEICNFLKEKRKKYDISWFCFGRVDTASDELYKLMKEAGCYFIQFGVEHLSNKVLDYYKKNTTKEKIENALKIAKKNGIGAYASVIIGAPVEDEVEFEKNIQFFKKNKVDILDVHKLMVFPGSSIWDDMNIKYPEKMESLWEKPIFYYDIDETHLTKDEVNRRQKRLIRAFYMSPRFVFETVAKIVKVYFEKFRMKKSRKAY